MNFRNATYDEFKKLVLKALDHEYKNYRTNTPIERQEQTKSYIPDYLWYDRCCRAIVTEDGKSICVTVQNNDGSTYLYCVYVDEDQRNNKIGTNFINNVKEWSKNRVSLHVALKDKKAYNLYLRLGFKPNGMSEDKSSIFMVTQKGLAGRYEWGVN